MIATLKSQLKRGVVRFARTHGYHLTPEWRLDAQPLVNHLRKILFTYQIDCVLDVGGNLGQFHDMLRDDVGWGGLILSFEPVTKYADHLRARCATEPKWHVLDYALGSRTETATINITSSPGLNSILAPRSDAVPWIWSADSITGTEPISVRTLDGTLDGLKTEHGFSRPYLKLDTQGYDLEVLKGASTTLSDIRALQTEASVKPIYHGQPGFIECLQHLEQSNFELSGMFPVTHDHALRLIEFDCVLINRRFADGVASNAPREQSSGGPHYLTATRQRDAMAAVIAEHQGVGGIVEE